MFGSTEPFNWFPLPREALTVSVSDLTFGGTDGTRTRDPLRDRQVF